MLSLLFWKMNTIHECGPHCTVTAWADTAHDPKHSPQEQGREAWAFARLLHQTGMKALALGLIYPTLSVASSEWVPFGRRRACQLPIVLCPVARSALSSSHLHPCFPPHPCWGQLRFSSGPGTWPKQGAKLGPKILGSSILPPGPKVLGSSILLLLPSSLYLFRAPDQPSEVPAQP